MQRAGSLTLEELRRFLEGSEEITFAVDGKADLYNWIGKVLQGEGVWAIEQGRAGAGEAIPGEGERTEPGAANAAGGTLAAGGKAGAPKRRAAAFCAPIPGRSRAIASQVG